MLNAQNCIISNGALCEVLSIWWRPILNCAVYCYGNFIENQMIRLTVWQKRVHTFFRQVLLISAWHLVIFDFQSRETNRTKILQKLWCARLQIGVEGVKGHKWTFTYPPVFFLPLLCPPLKKEGHIALHMSVGMSVGRSVGRYVGIL